MSYGLYIGKNLTSDGHAWLAGYGDEIKDFQKILNQNHLIKFGKLFINC
jgi:hypothetical protein|tara:strand:+ start:595 stop:741 length:147 start_codon:yes stop_codon:yes gene_type:complete